MKSGYLGVFGLLSFPDALQKAGVSCTRGFLRQGGGGGLGGGSPSWCKRSGSISLFTVYGGATHFSSSNGSKRQACVKWIKIQNSIVVVGIQLENIGG